MCHERKRIDSYSWTEIFELTLVSIITPCRNRLPLLKRMIDSVRSQTLQDWELLLLDDSDPDSRKEVERYVEADHRIKIFLRDGLGPDLARKLGVEHATGRYVTFLDSDDYWRKDRLKKHVQVWENNRIGLSWDRWVEGPDYICHIPNIPELQTGLVNNRKIAARMFVRNLIHCSSGFTTKHLINSVGGFPGWTSSCDLYLYIRLLEKYPAYFISDVLTFKGAEDPHRLGVVFSRDGTGPRETSRVGRKLFLRNPRFFLKPFILLYLMHGRKNKITRKLFSRYLVDWYRYMADWYRYTVTLKIEPKQ